MMASSALVAAPLLPLPGRTRTEDERILLARVGFVRVLCADPRVAACLADLNRTTGLLAAADHFAPLASALAGRLGLRNRIELLLDPHVGSAIDAVPVTAEYEALVVETQRARDAAYRAYTAIEAPVGPSQRETARRVAAHLEGFLRGVGLPWRWLATELAEQYRGLFWAAMYGHRMTHERALGLGLGPGATCRPAPGDDPAAAYQRAVGPYAADVKRYLAARRRAKLAGPKSDGRYLERYAEWFYRHRVKGETCSRIAREVKTSAGNVKRGIAVVEPLLDLPHERFSLR